MRGSEIANKLHISTSALKHYEVWGLIPKVERAANGYRVYTREHEAYFQCIRSLKAGFGMDLVRKIMPLLMKGEVIQAFWLINQAQVYLYKEKKAAELSIQALDLKEFYEIPIRPNKERVYTIGEVAQYAHVSPSSIRHWEKENLIEPKRQPYSRFRIYTASDLRKVLIIKAIQRAVYSLNIVREVLSEINADNVIQAKEIVQRSLIYLDETLSEQIKGITAMQNLLTTISERGRK